MILILKKRILISIPRKLKNKFSLKNKFNLKNQIKTRMQIKKLAFQNLALFRQYPVTKIKMI